MSADWAAARLIAPVEEYASDQWREHWLDHPDTFLQVLGDIYRVYKSEEAKRNGTANPQGGRRKTVIQGNVAELWTLVTPQFSTEAFADAFAAAQNGRSLRQVAMRSGMSPSTLCRFIGKGKRSMVPSRFDLERIAKALDVHPAYFREWREAVVCEHLAALLAARPNLSISLLKAIS